MRIPPPPPSSTYDIESIKILDGSGFFPNAQAPTSIDDYYLTSTSGWVDIHMTTIAEGFKITYIKSSILDYEGLRTGLRILDRPPGAEEDARGAYRRGVVVVEGDRSNTFTGDTVVEKANMLVLSKTQGATAISGDIFIRDGGALLVERNNQISNRSNIHLDGRMNLAILFVGQTDDSKGEYINTETIGDLTITGVAAVGFDIRGFGSHIYLSDLVIDNAGLLNVAFWVDGKDKILVRKDSEHLQESLGRIQFAGYNPNRISLIDHNADYWEISAIPEPAAYGAALGALGLGVVVWRRRARDGAALRA